MNLFWCVPFSFFTASRIYNGESDQIYFEMMNYRFTVDRLILFVLLTALVIILLSRLLLLVANLTENALHINSFRISKKRWIHNNAFQRGRGGRDIGRMNKIVNGKMDLNIIEGCVLMIFTTKLPDYDYKTKNTEIRSGWHLETWRLPPWPKQRRWYHHWDQ